MMDRARVRCLCGVTFMTDIVHSVLACIPPVSIERSLSACPTCGRRYEKKYKAPVPDMRDIGMTVETAVPPKYRDAAPEALPKGWRDPDYGL